jgi:hypothetical protein
LDVPRPVLYQGRIEASGITVNDPQGLPLVLSGLEVCMKILDITWGREGDQEEEKVIEELEGYWRPEGTPMSEFRTEFWRKKKKAAKEADLV